MHTKSHINSNCYKDAIRAFLTKSVHLGPLLLYGDTKCAWAVQSTHPSAISPGILSHQYLLPAQDWVGMKIVVMKTVVCVPMAICAVHSPLPSFPGTPWMSAGSRLWVWWTLLSLATTQLMVIISFCFFQGWLGCHCNWYMPSPGCADFPRKDSSQVHANADNRKIHPPHSSLSKDSQEKRLYKYSWVRWIALADCKWWGLAKKSNG